MNEIQIFKNDQFGEIRTIEKEGEPWFVGKDVAHILGYARTADAIRAHVDSEDKGVCKTPTPSGEQDMTIINESGLYSLILSSKLPNAKAFKRWVTSEVLPSIRKHGAYMTDNVLKQAIADPDFMIGLLQDLKKERSARIEAEKKRDLLIHQSKLYTTSEIAKELGMKSAIALNKILERDRIQYKCNSTWLLYSKYADCGLVSIKQDVLDNGRIVYNRRWTGVGRDLILSMYSNK